MLETAIAGVGALLVLIVGLLVRALIAVAIIAVLVIPIAATVVGWTWLVRAFDRFSGLRQVGHIRWRDGCYYTPGHLWLRPSGHEAVRIGVDDVGQRVLPAIAAVNLPMAGMSVHKGEPIGEIRCADGAVTLRAPISGVVDAVNDHVADMPELLHRDPYRRGWLVQMSPADSTYRTTLPMGERARAWLAAEDQRLTEFFERQLGIAAADGGELVLPPHRLLTAEQWQAMRAEFLEA